MSQTDPRSSNSLRKKQRFSAMLSGSRAVPAVESSAVWWRGAALCGVVRRGALPSGKAWGGWNFSLTPTLITGPTSLLGCWLLMATRLPHLHGHRTNPLTVLRDCQHWRLWKTYNEIAILLLLTKFFGERKMSWFQVWYVIWVVALVMYG